MAPHETPDDAWARALDQIEADVIVAEQLLADRVLGGGLPAEPTPWATPALATPMPSQHVDRARSLLARQVAVLADLPAATQQVRRQLDVTTRIGAASAPTRRASVYIDASA